MICPDSLPNSVAFALLLSIAAGCGSSDGSGDGAIEQQACSGPAPPSQEDCGARSLATCDADCLCFLGIAYAIDPDTACVRSNAETKPVACNSAADVDASLTTALDPKGRLWVISLDDLPEGWLYSNEPVHFSCDEGT